MRPALVPFSSVRFHLILATVFALLIPVPAKAQEPLPCGIARISGVVTGSDNKNPIEDVFMYVYGEESFSSTQTDSNGRYSVDVPAFKDPGPFVVDASPSLGGRYLGNTVDVSSPVISGTVTTVDVAVDPGGVIVGTVKAADTGLGLEDIFVSAEPVTNFDIVIGDSAFTDSSGSYRLEGLETGEYYLRFDANNINLSSDYVTVFLGGGIVISESLAVSVTAGLTTTTDMTLQKGIELVGKVTRSDNGQPVPNATIYAYPPVRDSVRFLDLIGNAFTDSSGNYRIRAIAPGTYAMGARPLRNSVGSLGSTADLLPQWYDNQAYFADTDLVTVPTGMTTHTVNMTMTPGATITGTLTDGNSGAPIADVDMRLYDVGDIESDAVFSFGGANTEKTDTSGRYALGGLYAGVYNVAPRFLTGTPYGTQGYPQVSSGAIVTVTGKQTVANVNLSRVKGGVLGGKLTDAGGNPLTNIEVRLELADGKSAFVSLGRTDQDGNYLIEFLSPGDYRVRYQRWDACGCFNDDYYKVAPNPQPALVPVISEGLATADAVLSCNAPPPVGRFDLYLPLLSVPDNQP